jgi:outer membrane protein assembly factor BamD (BamD/ComL family)
MLARFITMNWGKSTAALSALFLLAGCQGTHSQVVTDVPPPQIQDVATMPPPTFKKAADMAQAEQFYVQEDYEGAAKLFGKVADEKSTPPQVAEKARFFEAESQRMLMHFPDAMATFNRMLMDFQYGVFKEKAVGRMFEIANYWLDDTRKQMAAEQEKADGKRTFVPWNFVHTDKTKPFLDEEGHALKMLEQVYYYDPTGPYAERALYMAGYVNFHKGNYRAADQLLTYLIEMNDKNGKTSKLRDQAIQMAILAKNNSIGGPEYDPRKTAESLRLIKQARATIADAPPEYTKFLDDQERMIRYMLAEKDFTIAEFYMRWGQPASAWFQYELVRRRYQDVPKFHDQAVARMSEIHGDLTEQQRQTELARAARQTWNKWAFGKETPTLAKGAELPKLPEQPKQPERQQQAPQLGNDQILPVSGQGTPMPIIAPK